MYTKIFGQIFDSSIADDYVTRHVFMDLLVLANSDGEVDMTPGAIARKCNIPLEIVTPQIEKLCQPDPLSRTADCDGRRLVSIDPHRAWGWRIVNYEKYRSLRDEESRREANRQYKREQRQRSGVVRHGQALSAAVSHGQALSAHAEAEEEREEEREREEQTDSLLDGFAFSDWFDTAWMRHPKKSERVLAEHAAVKHLSQQGNRDTFDRHHTLWCNSEAWTEKQGSYCPKLANWIEDGGWRTPPPCAAHKSFVEDIKELCHG